MQTHTAEFYVNTSIPMSLTKCFFAKFVLVQINLTLANFYKITFWNKENYLVSTGLSIWMNL